MNFPVPASMVKNMAVKKRAFSAIQPSGIPTLGNYFGSIKNWVPMQDEYDCVYAIADLHSITVRQNPGELKSRTRYLYALLLAAGVEPAKTVLFVQSHAPQHAELTWVLSCHAMFGELSRMTQFKDKSSKNPDNINAGLFTYPVLMASDILLYDAAAVPIGHDQKQHVELARDIAARFNGIYRNTFIVPEPFTPKLGGRIMSLADPSRKMDKSDPNPAAFISLADDKDTIIKKFKRAVTDSDSSVRFDPENKPGVSNLLSIYALCSGKTIEECEAEFDGKGYGEFKPAVGEAVDSLLAPLRGKISYLLDNPAHLDKLAGEGQAKACEIAEVTLARVYDAVGFYRRGR